MARCKWSLSSLFVALWGLAMVLVLANACVDDDGLTADEADGPGSAGGKEDSGWLGPDSYEVNAVVHATVYADARGEWAELAADDALQQRLIDAQLKFIKNTAESHGWRFNQLADTVEVVETTVGEGGVAIEYRAVVDLLGRYRGTLPALEDIDPATFSAKVPLDPTWFSWTQISNCSESDDGHSAASYNFHYYFAPEKEGCDIRLTDAEVTITEVFPRRTVYPEYDQLMLPMDDETVGFRAALVPNRGDDDPLSRFNAHAEMLEDDLDLEGVTSEDGRYRRYTWQRDGVTMVIDLYDPTKITWESSFAAEFRARLGEYSLVHYNGHSSYGTTHLLDEPESFSDAYQIVVMHSCQSYAYYTRQVFRAKATEEDPSGFALADVVATGRSSYPSGSPPTLRVLLQSLMDGMVAIETGQPERAPDWLTITRQMDYSTWGDIMYGVAGVRTNRWQPAE
jgi:hypothetical protein